MTRPLPDWEYDDHVKRVFKKWKADLASQPSEAASHPSPVLQFMTYEQLVHELSRYEYRPGWELSIFNDPWEGPCLYVEMTVADGYCPSATIDLRIRSAIPPMYDSNHFGYWLLWRLDQIERHECREMLHCDGKPLVDPHAPIEPGSDR